MIVKAVRREAWQLVKLTFVCWFVRPSVRLSECSAESNGGSRHGRAEQLSLFVLLPAEARLSHYFLPDSTIASEFWPTACFCVLLPDWLDSSMPRCCCLWPLPSFTHTDCELHMGGTHSRVMHCARLTVRFCSVLTRMSEIEDRRKSVGRAHIK